MRRMRFLLIYSMLLIAGQLALPQNALSRLPRKLIWSIGIYQDETPLKPGRESAARNPVLTYRDVKDVVAVGVADPFLFQKDGLFYMFFEVINSVPIEQGDIGYAISRDGINWRYERIILNETFHLSYPQVFEWEGEIYMIPETNQTSTVRIYRATDFPTKWEFVKTLIDERLADPSILFHEDNWYLFCGYNVQNRWDTTLLFTSPDLLGPWSEHPASPIIEHDRRFARPGGRILAIRNKLYRFVQDCEPKYGRQLYAFEIKNLSPTEFREKMYSDDPILQPGTEWYGGEGMHHLDAILLPNGKWLCAVDGRRSQPYHRPKIKRKR